jgi:pimeloyl-ACP methyl ester carboxylesterase
VARELALIDGPRVSHLVLTNTEIPFHRPPWIPLYQAMAHVPGFGSILRQVIRLHAFRRSPLGFGGCFHDPSHLDGEFQARFVEPLIASGERIQEVLRFLRQMKFSRLGEFDRLHRQLTMPTLLLWGADDPTFPEARARQMATGLPNVVGFHALPHAKLFFYAERPEEVARRIAAFVGARAG